VSATERGPFALKTNMARLFETSPAGQTAMWMLLRWSTPPSMSEALDVPVRSRFMVVSLFPKASRSANGNSAASKGFCTSADMTSSISTAFIVSQYGSVPSTNYIQKIGILVHGSFWKRGQVRVWRDHNALRFRRTRRSSRRA
jgi:hypothetical protein